MLAALPTPSIGQALRSHGDEAGHAIPAAPPADAAIVLEFFRHPGLLIASMAAVVLMIFAIVIIRARFSRASRGLAGRNAGEEGPTLFAAMMLDSAANATNSIMGARRGTITTGSAGIPDDTEPDEPLRPRGLARQKPASGFGRRRR